MQKFVRKVRLKKSDPLKDYRNFPGLSPLIDEIEHKAGRLRKRLKGRKIWMVNSTETGGGVAEMLPTLMSMFSDLRIPVSWLVVTPEDPAFFLLTKKLHHLLHGRKDGGSSISDQEKGLYELDSQKMAQALEKVIGVNDLVIVHDPQPLAAGAFLSNKRKRLKMVWRCHIGTEFDNVYSKLGWQFLKPFFGNYRETLFTHPDYIPRFLKKKSSILYPAIDPLSDKNNWLSTEEMVEIFHMSGLLGRRRRGFMQPVKQLMPNGKQTLPHHFDPITMPIILEVSRWDHLKGFIPLMKGFLHMKRKAKETRYRGLRELTRNMIRNSVLVLAGPQVGTVADDPEPAIVLEEIKTFYASLSKREQAQIYLFLLPMDSKRENALIVNALQRSADIIVQNSIREGFGLTVTEAQWKVVPILATGVGGIRLQVLNHETGLVIKNPLNSKEVGENLLYLLTHKNERRTMARRAWLRSIEMYLIPALLRNYLDIMSRNF